MEEGLNTRKGTTSLSRARTLLSKARENAVWDLAFLQAHHLSRSQRIQYVLAKYRAIMTNSRSVFYLGAPFHYDNRWTPALLQTYPIELQRLDERVSLRTVRTVLDVGANVGQFAATALALFPHMRVWSLEPNRSIFSLLQRNSERHPHWRVLPYGLADEDQRRKLWFVPEKSAQGSVYKDNSSSGLLGGEPTYIDVELRRLTPRLALESGMPTTFDLVKIDVEGFEHEALLGLQDITWKHLTLEASVGRSGRFDDPEALVRRLWGDSCQLIYASAPDRAGVTRELVFSKSG